MSEQTATQTEKNNAVENIPKPATSPANGKVELQNGKISTVPGSNRRHNLIGSNTTVAVGSRLRGHKCELYVNDMRVKISANSFCYPDVVIVSGEPKFEGGETDLLVNPTVIVEIISKRSLYNDKTEKLESYLAMDCVRECLLIKEEELRVEHYLKQGANQWIYRIYNKREDTVSLDSISCKTSLAEIYSQISFDKV
jgi:Uma2 family endonuclease